MPANNQTPFRPIAPALPTLSPPLSTHNPSLTTHTSLPTLPPPPTPPHSANLPLHSSFLLPHSSFPSLRPSRYLPAVDPLTTALAHHRAGRTQDAIAIVQSILQNKPTDPHAVHLLGLLLSKSDPAAAEKHL